MTAGRKYSWSSSFKRSRSRTLKAKGSNNLRRLSHCRSRVLKVCKVTVTLCQNLLSSNNKAKWSAANGNTLKCRTTCSTISMMTMGMKMRVSPCKTMRKKNRAPNSTSSTKTVTREALWEERGLKIKCRRSTTRVSSKWGMSSSFKTGLTTTRSITNNITKSVSSRSHKVSSTLQTSLNSAEDTRIIKILTTTTTKMIAITFPPSITQTSTTTDNVPSATCSKTSKASNTMRETTIIKAITLAVDAVVIIRIISLKLKLGLNIVLWWSLHRLHKACRALSPKWINTSNLN